MVSQESSVDAGLKAVSDATRRGILGLLKVRQLSVLEIAEEFPMSRPAISKHLRILKEAGLVLETPSGRQRLYALQRAPLAILASWLAGFNGKGPEKGLQGGRAGAGASTRHPQRWAPPRASGDDWRVW